MAQSLENLDALPAARVCDAGLRGVTAATKVVPGLTERLLGAFTLANKSVGTVLMDIQLPPTRFPQSFRPQRTAVLVPRFGARIRRGRGHDYRRRHR